MPGQCKFSYAERLHRRAEYRAVFAHGEKLVGRHFVCHVVRREEAGCKLGIVVSRKVGNAVVRNRVKRYLREFYRTHRNRLTAPVYLVVVARPACAGLSYQESADAMVQLLRRGGVLDG